MAKTIQMFQPSLPSLALGISDIPWGGPVGAVRVGQIDGKFVFNPTYEEREKTNMDMVVCGKDGKG